MVPDAAKLEKEDCSAERSYFKRDNFSRKFLQGCNTRLSETSGGIFFQRIYVGDIVGDVPRHELHYTAANCTTVLLSLCTVQNINRNITQKYAHQLQTSVIFVAARVRLFISV